MGLVQAAIGALGGTLADQWKDFYTVPGGLAPTAALFAAVPQGQNAGRGSNTHGSEGVISNGSRILVPEGYGLVLMQDGAITGFAAQAGAYEWNSEAQDSQSIFAGNDIVSSTVATSWERFKFGGRPGTQQRAYFVTLKELPNNRFGTQSEIYWDDAYMNAQVGAVTRGTYTLREIRGGKLNDPRMGTRMKGEGIFADYIAKVHRMAREKAGIPTVRMPLSTANFRVPGTTRPMW